MKRKLTPEFIDAQPMLASSPRYLRYRPAGLDVFLLPRDVLTLGNVICIGLTGSGKTCGIAAVLNSVMHAEPHRSVTPNDALGMFSGAVPHPLCYPQRIEKMGAS